MLFRRTVCMVAWVASCAGFLLAVGGCSAPNIQSLDLTAGESAYLVELDVQPTEFLVSQEESAAVWLRAQEFFQTYIEPTTAPAISHMHESLSYRGGQLLVSASKTPKGTHVRFKAGCMIFGGGMRSGSYDTEHGSNAWYNARILSRYMQSGELPYPRLFQRH